MKKIVILITITGLLLASGCSSNITKKEQIDTIATKETEVAKSYSTLEYNTSSPEIVETIEKIKNKVNEETELKLFDNVFHVSQSLNSLYTYDSLKPHYKLDLYYPSINNNKYTEVNEMLKTQVLKNILKGNTNQERMEYAFEQSQLAYELLLKEHKNQTISDDEIIRDTHETTYKVLDFNQNYISVIYYLFSVVWANPSENQFIITIDLNTHQYIKLTDVTEPEKIVDAIEDNQYTIYLGKSGDMGTNIYNQTLKQDFIKSFSEYLEWEDNNSDSIPYFGMDEENIYVYFTSEYALKDRLILQIPRDAL